MPRQHSRAQFQFTPPCGGGGVHHPRVNRYEADFNSRPRVGAGFGPFPVTHCINSISIHAPVWGRAAPPLLGGQGGISIHAPVWGAGANLHKCKVLFMCKMVETRDRINGKRWIISKLVQYTAGGFVLLEQKHPGRYCANLPAYFVLPRSAQQPAYRRIGSPVCTRPVRPMVSMRV